MPPASLRLTRFALAAAGASSLLGAKPAAAACWASANGVNFGSYDPQAAGPADSAGTITAECDRREQSVSLSLGSGLSGNFAARTMLGGGGTLQYNLFTGLAHSQVWGDGSSGTGTMSLSLFPNRPVAVPVYGRIPPGQNVRAGSYADTIIVTIEY